MSNYDPSASSDLYEKRQLGEWKVQYKFSSFDTNNMVFFTGLSDREELDPDGSGLLGSHRTEGDGLRASEEYRGYVVDRGPKNFNGGHVRISLAKKELLVEVSEMPGIQSSISAGENPGVTYSLSGIISSVMELYCRSTGGAGIDVYWAKDAVVVGEPIDYNEDGVFNPDEGDRQDAYCWTGSVYKKTNDVERCVNGGGAFVETDYKLVGTNRTKFDRIFRMRPGGSIGACFQLEKNRNSALEKFAKLLLVTRRGIMNGPKEPEHPLGWCSITENNAIAPVTSDFRGDGAYISVTGIAEEGPYRVGDPNNLNYSTEEYLNVLHFCVAHELCHLLVGPIHPGELISTALMNNIEPVSRNGISITQLADQEMIHINVSHKRSVE
jgi:hypothetical protein